MQVMTVDRRVKSHADRQARYRDRKGDSERVQNAKLHRDHRASAIPEFIGVDSEGIGRGKNHRAVLLGVGKESYIARDLRRGLQWDEVFSFLYEQFQANPKAAFVGFFLSYDFNNWLSTLPEQAAYMLFSPRGKATRRRTQVGRTAYYPVRCEGWEFDMLGMKRLQIRPRVCQCVETKAVCNHAQKPWMYVCDSGAFFQMSFLKVLESALKDKSDTPVCSPAEFAKVKEGKDNRATARLNKKMIEYNVLENLLLARVMARMATGFAKVGIHLAKDQWYGPGASAQQWLRKKGALKQDAFSKLAPDWFIDACRKSYFGGWFEIFSHGLILGTSYNYDINNAYPYAASNLPHICGECRYSHGRGDYKGNGKYVLLHCTVSTKGNRIGAVPYRDSKGSILRPSVSKGWYWKHELDASRQAGLVKDVVIHQWVAFTPCDHPVPFADIAVLYQLRLDIGKDTAQGMAIKLNNNSIYGKFAQSVGAAPYNNWLYASLITSMCRTQILQAIGTHPRKAKAVLMVATDGICFDSVHPNLPVSKKLGEWAYTEYTDLCLFKPGVYWHHEGKEALLKVKSRGVPKNEFIQGIESVEEKFRIMLELKRVPGDYRIKHELEKRYPDDTLMEGAVFQGSTKWPWFSVEVNFRLKSCRQALNEGEWNRAATVQEKVPVLQNSDPENKRRNVRYSVSTRRLDTEIHCLAPRDIQTRYYGEVKMPHGDPGYGYDGDIRAGMLEAAETIRGKAANYDLPLGEDVEWVTVWDGGPING